MTSALTETTLPHGRKRKFKLVQAILGLLLLVSVVWLGLYLRSDAFRELVRSKVVAELELVTGGRVEIESLTWNLFRLQFEAKEVTIHGREAQGQAPLVHMSRLLGQARITSILRREVGLRLLVIDRPVLHLVLFPDGSTNLPMPKIPSPPENNPVQRLFDLAVGRMEINNAQLLLNDKKFPFDFSGNDLSGGMSYSKADKDYEGNFSIDLLAVHYQGLEPLKGALELHFRMTPFEFNVEALKLKMGGSVLSASGMLRNYRQPQVHFQYSASLELPEVSRIAGIPQLQGGHLELNGSAAYQNQWYEARGTLAARNVTWREADWNLTGVDLASPFLVTPEKISLAAINGKIFGGSALGNFQIANWNSQRSAEKTVERGTLGLRGSGVQLSLLATAVSTRRLPLNKVNLAGGVSGDVNWVWTGSTKNTTAQMKLEVDPPANPASHLLPVTASFQGTYHRAGQVVDVAGLSFATRDIRLNATGTLGSSEAQLKIAFNANDLRELQPVLATWSADAQVPLDVHGRASFNGTLSGKFSAISARGRLDLQDFDTLLGPIHALVARNAATKIHWDSMLADVLVTPSSVSAQNGVLKRGVTQVVFSGSTSLSGGQFDAQTSVMSGTLQIQNASLAETQLLAGFHLPLSGTLNASVRATGTLRNLRGSGTLSATKLALYGEPFAQFRSDINFAGEETQFNNLLLVHDGAQLTGSAALNPLAGSFRFDLRGANIELADFSRLQPGRFPLSGRAEFHASGSVAGGTPSMNAELTIHRLVVSGDAIGDLTASAQTQGEDLMVRAGISFQGAAFNLEGSVRLRDTFPAQMTLKFDHLDFDPFIRAYLGPSITAHSLVQGSIELRGPVTNPRALSVVANISQFSANIQNVKIHNDGPLRFSCLNEAIHVDQFHLVGEETDFSLRGDADLGGTQTLDVHADGKLDLKLLQTLDPDVTSSGMAALEAHLTGTVGDPQIHGRMDITNAAISAGDLPNGLSQINGRLVFAQDRMQIERLRAHTGGGDLDLTGFIAYRAGLYFDVTATGNDVRVRYPPGLSSSLNAGFRFTGSAQASLLSGNATLIRLAVDPRFDFAQYLARARNAGRAGPKNQFLENLRLDIHIVSTPELRVETSLAKVSGDADLRIRGTAANPAILGRVNIAEGDVSFSGTKYRLQRGDITFSNPQVIQPIINVEMAARVRDYDITIGFHGPVDRLNITYSSEPPMSSSDIIALLAFGRTKQAEIYGNEPGSNQPASTPLTTSDTLLEQALTTANTSRVQKLFGVGNVKVDPQVIGPENNLGPRVTIEQQIQNNVTVTYITNVAQSTSEQVIQLEYNLTKSISVVAVRDYNGILSFEVRIKKRKK